MEELDASYGSGITQEGIQDCRKLKRLYVDGNRRITSVNHLPELEELDASYGSGITQEGIQGCQKLKRLYAGGNAQITSVNHLCELELLVIDGEKCGISDSGFRNCHKIRKLNIRGNRKVADLNHLSYLEELVVSNTCRVEGWGVHECLRLKRVTGSGCWHLISYLAKRDSSDSDSLGRR